MEETCYIVEYSYPSGHEMSHGSYGPGTEADLRTELAENGISEESIHSLFSYGEGEEIYSFETAETLRLVPVRDYVVVVTSEDGISIYGPYTPAEAEAAISKIEPYFVNPFLLADEAEDVQDKSRIRTAEQCAGMGYNLGGYLNEDVTFNITRLEKP